MLKKVLVVEDSALLVKMYRFAFGAYPGCETLCAFNGVEGLDQLTRNRDVDLIVLDINMPKMDGLTFLVERQRLGFGGIPVIVVSTEGKDDDIRRALAAGAKAFVKKPWTPSEFRALVMRVTGAAPGKT